MHAASTEAALPLPATPPLPVASANGDAALRIRLEHYLYTRAGAPVAVTSFRRLSAGLSWTTAAVRVNLPASLEAPPDLILKLGPVLGLMAPYSALPEALAARTFTSPSVPVPTVRWYSDDESILGGPFLICDRVAGDALNPFVADYGAADPAVLPALGRQLAEMLASIHATDWSCRPIAGLAPAAGLQGTRAMQELRFWRERARRWALRPVPMLDLAGAWLTEHCPANARPSVVHGDYRVGNFLSVGNRVTSILDWEMVHIGDHHEDIAWAFMPEFRLAGLVSLADFKHHYAASGGQPLDDRALQYYVVFCLYKLAVINLGASYGFEHGADDLRLGCLGLTTSSYLERLGRALSKRFPMPPR